MLKQNYTQVSNPKTRKIESLICIGYYLFFKTSNYKLHKLKLMNSEKEINSYDKRIFK